VKSGHTTGTAASHAPERQGVARHSLEHTSRARLLDLNAAADYLGISYWTVRDLIHAGELPTVKPRGRDGRTIRRILIDVQDLDTLIERWKEREAV
jgi:excisionase family DNA binding protein